MTDVFEGVPVYDGTGVKRDLAWLRKRYGPNLTGTWPGWTLERIFETEGSMTMLVQFLTSGGAPLAGRPVRWSWEQGAQSFAGQADAAGLSNWTLGSNEWVAAGGDAPGHTKGAYILDSGPVHLEGLGWAGGTNHSKPNFVFREGTAAPPVDPPGVPPSTPTGVIWFTQEEAMLLRAAATTIDTLVQTAVNRPGVN